MTPHDLVVVGGGMTGSALALGAARQGWDVVLVEAAPEERLLAELPPAATVAEFEPRVSAISVASQRLLADLGVWSSVTSRRHCPYTEMEVWDGDGTGRIRFDAASLHAPALGTIVENHSLVHALFTAAARSPLTRLTGARVSALEQAGDRRVVCLADGSRLPARLVVAADGGQSRLRQWAGLATREWDYEQQAIVCTVATERSHQDTAWQRFSTTGPLAFLPLGRDSAGGGGHFSSIVWSQDNAEASRLMALDSEAFAGELGRAIEHRLGAITAVSRRYGFPLRQRHAKDYVRPGFAVIGDAAHTIHPLAGQGANLGYGDVRVLLDELAGARSRHLNPGDPLLLARYQRRRKGENLAMMAAMEGFKQLFARDELSLRWLRNTGMRWLDQAGPLKHRIAARAMGL